MWGSRKLRDRLDRLTEETRASAVRQGQLRTVVDRGLTQIQEALSNVEKSVSAEVLRSREELAGVLARLATQDEIGSLAASIGSVDTRLRDVASSVDRLSRAGEEQGSSLAALRTDVGGVSRALATAGDRFAAAVDHSAGMTSERLGRMEAATALLSTRGDMESLAAKIDALNQRIDEVDGRLSKVAMEGAALIEKPAADLTAFRADLSGAIAEFKEWRRSVMETTQQSLASLKRAMEAAIEENRKVSASLTRTQAQIEEASREMGSRLTRALDLHLNETFLPRLNALLETLDKMVRRLEVRGGSLHKTARSKILQYMMSKANVGGKHQAKERIITSALHGPEAAEGEEAIESLVRDNLIVKKPTGYGNEYSVNPQRIADVHRVINGEDV